MTWLTTHPLQGILSPSDCSHSDPGLEIQDPNQHFSKALFIAIITCYCKDPCSARLKLGDSVSSNVNYVNVLYCLHAEVEEELYG